jgi:hypothetical protein
MQFFSTQVLHVFVEICCYRLLHNRMVSLGQLSEHEVSCQGNARGRSLQRPLSSSDDDSQLTHYYINTALLKTVPPLLLYIKYVSCT